MSPSLRVNRSDLTTKARRSQSLEIARFDVVPARTEVVAAGIVDAAVTVHKALGPGLLESVYEVCLCRELAKRDIAFQRQVALPICYDGIRLETGFRIDVLADNCVIIELKSVEVLTPLHEAQMLTYLKLSDQRLGFLLNFNVSLMKQGIKRIVL